MAETRIVKGDRAADRFNMPPGTWLRITADGTPTARMSCPGCGSAGSLVDHEISEQGNVTPSVDCTQCEYHEVGVVLVGWAGDDDDHADRATRSAIRSSTKTKRVGKPNTRQARRRRARRRHRWKGLTP